ncbi:adenylate/guanylate cyclase catalytic domain protein [Oesophagostomum dentatum]|uniref:Guanylate cyclase n=1 Tax=Oesophagostomum dentatum TaxID=61180 RepID=A0A0B1T8R0_OESDE|nr:adenylate/guanylate cyclase catalytic domain protein [Oesophagostomum dentatum]
MLLYALALNKSISAGYPNPTGTQLAQFASGTFEGFSGTVVINENLTRNPVFLIYGLDASDQQIILMKITENLQNDSIALVQELQPQSIIWAAHGGSPPLNRPKCDFDGSACPKSFVEQYLAIVIVGAVVPVAIIIAAALFITRSRKQEEKRLNALWQIPFIMLTKPNVKNDAQSSRSLQSTITTSTKLTIESKKDTQRHAFYLLADDAVVARKHVGKVLLRKADCSLLRRMRNVVDHDNLCKFLGLSLDGPLMLSVWRYCGRGSLKDVIAKGSLQMDWFFKYSLIRDICEGVYYLHHFVGAHGWISSGTCLVDERWQVKITFYGLDAIKMIEAREMTDNLWLSPEHIRDSSLPPTKQGDIYSFAIVCSEIITKKSAWDLENQDYDIEELIYKIKRGGRSPTRPSLETEDEHSSSLSLLVKDCWSEDIEMRPSCDQMKSLIKSMNHNKSSNLMDHVFTVLEQYASNLEDEVQARMKELTEEKKKSDVLLYRMLPKYVVNLLNDLYTVFDAIIDEHDVYKVETIGDGYLCVSGLPHRNGNDHAKEVAEMSFELLRAIKTFRIPHLPTEKINIRVGLHTGAIVTGVVGMTMPRYCLFGDAVNTASRMESNGKPGRVHISTEAMKFLTEVIGGYRTEPRGEVIVKGKGALETHWLLTPEEQERLFVE